MTVSQDVDDLRNLVSSPTSGRAMPADVGSARDSRVDRVRRRGRGTVRHRPCALPALARSRDCAALRGFPEWAADHGLRQHHPGGPRGAFSRRRMDGEAHPADHPLERRGHGAPRERQLTRHRRASVDICLQREPVRGRLQSLLPGQGQDNTSGDHIYFQGHAAPGIYSRAFLEGRLSIEAMERLPTRGRAGARAVQLPAPAADAELLGVPHGEHGPRSHQRDLPCALQSLPARSRDLRHVHVPGVGVPRGRGDGRARGAR